MTDTDAGRGQSDQLVFRLMKVEDIPAIMVIERQAFTMPWTEEAFKNELTNNHFAKYMVMELQGQIIGYAGLWAIVDEAHVTNIALLEEYRGRKWGERLLDELMKTASYLGMKSITLEVRVSNEVAQNLYRKKGFRSAGTRRGYYSDNREDALIMWADLPAYEEQGVREGSVE
ncbi:ribosomal protein S18-alanine N-acetyltransferase [Paenibacillus sp. sgz500958]|uniref:ribosomal protein S18-alanine N-acetyltransferase n=1 Tax=Paenibacillus sp. sgz500958 TaxID=3242475 RepID=UPI0036D413BC